MAAASDFENEVTGDDDNQDEVIDAVIDLPLSDDADHENVDDTLRETSNVEKNVIELHEIARDIVTQIVEDVTKRELELRLSAGELGKEGKEIEKDFDGDAAEDLLATVVNDQLVRENEEEEEEEEEKKRKRGEKEGVEGETKEGREEIWLMGELEMKEEAEKSEKVAPVSVDSVRGKKRQLSKLKGDGVPTTGGEDRDATATVKFVLLPNGQVATQRCPLNQTILALKKKFSVELKIPHNIIMLLYEGKNIEDNDSTLASLGVSPTSTIQLELASSDPVQHPIRLFKPRQSYQMPDVISVLVRDDDGAERDAVVEIHRFTQTKPFLGGFRHKETRTEYHNASAQTLPKPPAQPACERFSRDTQTVEQRHRATQAFNETATQMTGAGVYVSNVGDKLIGLKKYTTAEEYEAGILEKVITLQKYHRRWMATMKVKELREQREKRTSWEVEEEKRKKEEREERIRKEYERRMNPKTKEDFDLLYAALERWRQEELEKINLTLTGAERKAALCVLLDKETQLLASIDRHRVEAMDENKEKSVNVFLEKASASKQWKGHDGKPTKVDTPYTVRAQELRDIYTTINMKHLTQDERLDALLTLKQTVKEHDCKLTREIVELVNREADLLIRGVKNCNLQGLRKRIATLFLQYIKTPTFNPEASRLIKVPNDPMSLRKNTHHCSSCNQYLPSTEFKLSAWSKNVGPCRACHEKDNEARAREDYSTYRVMLKSLRRQEQQYSNKCRIAFLLQEKDLHYLVEHIWSGQSVLSAADDLNDLVIVRWNMKIEWSPWNCVLLTKAEAEAHAKVENVDQTYGKDLLQKVQRRHVLARNHFSRLPSMTQHVRVASLPAIPSGKVSLIRGATKDISVI